MGRRRLARQQVQIGKSAGRAAAAPTPTEIDTLSRDALLDLWPKAMDCPVPRGMSQVMLRRFLSFELQALAQGGLGRGDLEQIRRLTTGTSRAKTPRVSQGTRFLREWNGITHVVERCETGFLWNGSVYTSLSAIAKAITGAHWSGPRFFGITAASAAQPAKSTARVLRLRAATALSGANTKAAAGRTTGKSVGTRGGTK